MFVMATKAENHPTKFVASDGIGAFHFFEMTGKPRIVRPNRLGCAIQEVLHQT